ncbi:MAG: hypothetical protein ACPGR8_16775 [Limisphaerales bacterium]
MRRTRRGARFKAAPFARRLIVPLPASQNGLSLGVNLGQPLGGEGVTKVASSIRLVRPANGDDGLAADGQLVTRESSHVVGKEKPLGVLPRAAGNRLDAQGKTLKYRCSHRGVASMNGATSRGSAGGCHEGPVEISQCPFEWRPRCYFPSTGAIEPPSGRVIRATNNTPIID